MTEQEVRDFLAQFDEAPKRISEWPQWMQDAAYEAAATFPKSNVGVAPSPEAYAGPVTWTPEDEARLDAAIAKRNAARATRGVARTNDETKESKG